MFHAIFLRKVTLYRSSLPGFPLTNLQCLILKLIHGRNTHRQDRKLQVIGETGPWERIANTDRFSKLPFYPLNISFNKPAK